jgi:hypothetical protein
MQRNARGFGRSSTRDQHNEGLIRRMIAKYWCNCRLMTEVLEAHSMSLTPKGRSHSGSAALNHDENPGTSLAEPLDLSRGGKLAVGRIQALNNSDKQATVTCEVINWKKDEIGFESRQSFANANPDVKFGQHEGSFTLTSSREHDLTYFQHRAAESLDLPKSVNCKILAYIPSRKGIRLLHHGDFNSWRAWVLEGCPGECLARNAKVGHFYIAVDFADCLR